MRLDWFSPLPPAASGVAEYALTVIDTLARREQLRVWLPRGGDLDIACLPPSVEVRRFPVPELWRELNDADVTIYHLGNNVEYHGVVWEVYRRRPGVVVLHDASLQDFFAGQSIAEHGNLRAYADAMAREYGAAGRSIAAEVAAGRVSLDDLREHFPLTGFALEQALGVLVHDPGVFASLRERCSVPLALAALPYRPRVEVEEREETTGELRLLAFGHLGPNRGLRHIFRALSDLPRSFRFDLFGRVDGLDDLQHMVRSLGLQDKVKFHGPVSDERLDTALAAGDIALNLRYPTLGAASLSQLRIWGSGVPSIVARAGWFRHIPPSAAAFVRVGHEVEDVRARVLDLAADTDLRRRIAASGRRTLRELHDPRRYAVQLVRLSEAARRRSAQTAVTHGTRFLRGLLKTWTDSASRDHVATAAESALRGLVDRASVRRVASGADSG